MSIPAIPPIEGVLETVKTGTGAGGPLPDAAMTEKFQALMGSGDRSGPDVGSTDGPNALGKVMERQEALMRSDEQALRNLATNAPNMSIAELNLATLEISRSITASGFKMQASTAIAQGSNKSLQSLLKNQ
ncbi:hypothetical protein [Caldimonas brevitalea]|uniref:Type III secretion inner rod protein HrpB2 n=1 Tax=Caldimonas brevitalea TaxID=413882 RepID=A0A0G3BIN4_9BURK|nr:hypothetical protein [Caldimonas brevitalea]AKJ27828.1 type III secretion inner rod protein HrpB2 [Caldimonas brevitalea]